MHYTTMAMLAGLLSIPALPAAEQAQAEKASTPAEQFQMLKQELQKSEEKFFRAYKKAPSDKERQELRDEQNQQSRTYARRALDLAHKHGKDPVAVEALSWIITGGSGYQGVDNEIEAAFDLLRTDHATSDNLRKVCARAFLYDLRSTKPEQFLRAVLEKNPHHEVQGIACYGLGRILRRRAPWVKRLRDPALRKQWEKAFNKNLEKRVMANDPDKLLQEAEKLFELTLTKYGDVKTPNRGTLGEVAKATLFEMRHLVVGKVAPEIEGEDLDGKRFKLSDYRGKVVVLDFWGNW